MNIDEFIKTAHATLEAFKRSVARHDYIECDETSDLFIDEWFMMFDEHVIVEVLSRGWSAQGEGSAPGN